MRHDIVSGRPIVGGHVFRRGQRYMRVGVEVEVVVADPQGLAAHMHRVGYDGDPLARVPGVDWFSALWNDKRLTLKSDPEGT